MNDDRHILETAARWSADGKPLVMATVIRTQGSTPRDAGAKMLVGSNGCGTVGTVGGGQFEYLVLDAARKHLEEHSCGTEKFVLGADADQCCGGVMEVFFEYHGSRQRLVVFGAGHVSMALMALMEASSLELIVVDDRAEWNNAERFSRCRRILTWDEGVASVHERPQSTLACVMTCSHDTDFDILRGVLTKPPAFAGLIGSRSKRACLFGRLVAAGINEDLVQRVHCPIGVGDTGKEPRLVAISMAAQLLLEAKKLARA